jgi:hypothetical protein
VGRSGTWEQDNVELEVTATFSAAHLNTLSSIKNASECEATFLLYKVPHQAV